MGPKEWEHAGDGLTSSEMQSSSESERSAGDGEHYQEGINDDSPKMFSQTQLNDLTRELYLSKEYAQLLA
ncbi:unnamed protein product [Clavelina lepadiformis]|uniref:Uncharacterized protein n=1 Tax=Clavelina lepadiformis TaxID=159417 RepID=A0ABP0FWK3_CLALP